MNIKNLLAYALVALLAFLIGSESNFSLKKVVTKMRPADVAEDGSWGGRTDRKILETEEGEAQYSETATVGKYTNTKTVRSAIIGGDLIIPPGVFMPGEAEAKVLPLMQAHPELFKGKTVLEIGAGSGPISIFAAKLGATKVVSTDINPDAVAAIEANADSLGVGDIVEARLVSLDDMSAYAVIQPGEKFDIIISNPPYALDLDAPVNTAATDTGELGFSIVRGFEEHLNPDGMALLYYDSLFYHQVMKKYARYEGYSVISHNPIGLYTWAAETLFNSYLRRLLEKENMPADTISFKRDKDGLTWMYLRNQCLDPDWAGYQKLFPASDDNEYYPGWMTITSSEDGV
jgi:16S rRNA G1207 methylase RsmC